MACKTQELEIENTVAVGKECTDEAPFATLFDASLGFIPEFTTIEIKANGECPIRAEITRSSDVTPNIVIIPAGTTLLLNVENLKLIRYRCIPLEVGGSCALIAKFRSIFCLPSCKVDCTLGCEKNTTIVENCIETGTVCGEVFVLFTSELGKIPLLFVAELHNNSANCAITLTVTQTTGAPTIYTLAAGDSIVLFIKNLVTIQVNCSGADPDDGCSLTGKTKAVYCLKRCSTKEPKSFLLRGWSKPASEPKMDMKSGWTKCDDGHGKVSVWNMCSETKI